MYRSLSLSSQGSCSSTDHPHGFTELTPFLKDLSGMVLEGENGVQYLGYGLMSDE